MFGFLITVMNSLLQLLPCILPNIGAMNAYHNINSQFVTVIILKIIEMITITLSLPQIYKQRTNPRVGKCVGEDRLAGRERNR